ncbi:oxidoreductase [Massilia sp. 9096]|uniref:oxidoreductase n=1 Tax=Massilia sp. 9096 TaxID=1500894 RepID=UPI000563459B|nr:oxidoreductase [Massilia sp. 9096]
MDGKTLRVGIIGFGFAGTTFHAPLIRTTPGMAIAAVASSDAGKVHAALGRDVQVYADPKAMIAQAEIDLVVVASPNATHYELAALALDHGRHVVVDKPFTATVQEAEDLAQRARAKGVLLSVYHNRRWDSTTRTAQRLLDANLLGEVRQAGMYFDRFRPAPQARWKEDADALGGVWMDLGPHLLDEALLYFGMPEAIQADIGRLRPGTRCDDAFQVRLRYGDGLCVDLGASMLSAIPRPRLTLHGTRGSYAKQSLDPQEAMLKAGELPGDPRMWGIDTEQGVLVTGRDGQIEQTAMATENGAYPEYYRLVRDAILGVGPNPVPPEQAVRVMRLLDAGRQSSDERREISVAA